MEANPAAAVRCAHPDLRGDHPPAPGAHAPLSDERLPYGIPAEARLLRSTTFLLTGGLIELLIAWRNGSLDLTVDELITDAAALVSGTGEAAWRIAEQRSEHAGGS
jgi:hypothetical protein